jgi:DNA-binding NarL/FixJ family response regulator
VLDRMRGAAPESRVVMLTAVESVDDVVSGLTPREREVLQYMVDGLGRAEIAGRLRGPPGSPVP